MKRTLFLVSLGALAVAAAVRVRSVRATRVPRSAAAGGCFNHRARRWSGFTAADVLA